MHLIDQAIRYMNKKNLNQSQFAKLVNIERSRVSKLVNRKLKMNDIEKEKLERFFSVSDKN